MMSAAQTTGARRLRPDPVTRKKIVFVLPALQAGGAERVLVILSNNLDPHLFDVHFIALSDGPVRAWLKTDMQVHILGAPRIRGGFLKLYKTLKKIQPDIVVSSLIHMNALVLLMKPFLPKTKFVVRESSKPSALMTGYGVKGYICRYVYKFLYPYADLIISPAQVIIEEFKKDLKIPMKNHCVVYNPIEAEKILKSIDKEFSISSDGEKIVRFICVGRLSFEKGFDRLIQALAGFHPDHEWKLEIWGEGNFRSQLEKLIHDYNLKNHISLCGYTDNPWDKIARADCLLVPSFWEGMPNIVLEALVCGTPVIGIVDAGGITEISRLAPAGSVRVAQDMKDFIRLMSTVEPQKKTAKQDSLLPKDFELLQVMQRFESALKF